MNINHQVLKQVVIDQNTIQLPDPYVPRTELSQIKALQNTPDIVIIMGIRRCGKSTLLQSLRQEANEAHYYINFDDDRLALFQLDDFQILFEVFIELYGVQKTFFFDEIQNIAGWERFVRRLHEQKNKIYITGSNAVLFSKELGTRLTGRYIPFEIYPFSFREYANAERPELLATEQLTSTHKGEIKYLFARYIDLGGIPNYVQFQNLDYLHSLYESILYRDLITRYKLTDERVMKELAYYLASQSGKEITYNGLRKLLGIASVNTISNYCSYLENTYLCFFINRFSFSLKKQIHYAKKCYFVDTALAKNIGFRMTEDRGRLLETIVFIELKRRKKEIYFHQEKFECDFILRNGIQIEAAMQVCAEFTTPDTKEREINGLVEAMQAYNLSEGYILTYDMQNEENIEVNNKSYLIHYAPIWQWLLSDELKE